MKFPPRSLRSDEGANAALDAFLLLLLIVVPLGVFYLLYLYLRRTAPEGAVPSAESPAPAPAKMSGSSTTTCPRCGLSVRPFVGHAGRECPNCQMHLGTA